MDSRPLTAFHLCKLPTANGKLRAGGVAALVCVGLLALAGSLSAGPATGGVSGSTYYVWGYVGSPGAYTFIANPDLLELLSAAGGPRSDANLRRIVLIRAVAKKRIRIDLQTMMNKGQVLRLSPGDVVIVESTPWSAIRENLWVISLAASLASVVLLVMNRAGV